MSARKTSITVTVQLAGLREGLAKFRTLPKEAADELRDASGSIATALVAFAQIAARTQGRQASLMAPTVKVVRDRVPAIQAGGAKRVGRRRVPAYELLGGSEFGSNRFRQFRPFRADGYWFFPVADNQRDYADRQWGRAVERIVSKFEGGA